MDQSLEIGASEARKRFAEFLRETEQGRSFVILRRGKAVARLVPPNFCTIKDIRLFSSYFCVRMRYTELRIIYPPPQLFNDLLVPITLGLKCDLAPFDIQIP